MYGDAVLPVSSFDHIVDHPDQHYRLFGPPRTSVSDADYMIGVYSSALIRDGGELQIGIGIAR